MCRFVCFNNFGYSEIQYFGDEGRVGSTTFDRQKDVLRFEIAVDDSFAVRGR